MILETVPISKSFSSPLASQNYEKRVINCEWLSLS